MFLSGMGNQQFIDHYRNSMIIIKVINCIYSKEKTIPTGIVNIIEEKLYFMLKDGGTIIIPIIKFFEMIVRIIFPNDYMQVARQCGVYQKEMLVGGITIKIGATVGPYPIPCAGI